MVTHGKKRMGPGPSMSHALALPLAGCSQHDCVTAAQNIVNPESCILLGLGGQNFDEGSIVNADWSEADLGSLALTEGSEVSE